MMLLNFVNPSSSKVSKGKPSPAVAFAVSTVLIVGASAVAFAVYRAAVATPTADLAFSSRLVAVRATPLDVTIVMPGELQAVDNIDLISRVEGRTTITEIVKEGAYVKKDEVLVELDSQTIRQGIDDTTLEVQRAEAAVSNAREMLAIQESNNNAELEGATVALQLAELDLKKYVEGTFPQEEKTAATKLDMARTNLQTKQDELQQSKNLFTRGFAMANDVKKAELAVTEAKNGVQEAETALRVLREYNHQADLAGKQNALAQARSKLERVKRQNESMLVQKQADLTSADQQLALRQRKLDELKEQLEACVIKAPADGMVVYVNNPDNQSQAIQQGAEVRERQPILRLPDVSAMKAVMKLNEAQANRVQVGMRAHVEITGIPAPINGTVTKVSIVPVSGNRWMNPDSKEYPAEVTLDQTPTNLKPSTSAKSTIMVKSLSDVLAVPQMCIYSAGFRSFAFVVDGTNVEPREVVLGESSLNDVEVKSGLKVNEKVLRLEASEGKRLLEQAGVNVDPTTQPTGRDMGKPIGMPGGPVGGGPNSGPPNTGGPTMGAPNGGGPNGGGNGERRRRGEGGGEGRGMGAGVSGPNAGQGRSGRTASPTTIPAS
jgi:HlyD family secretion protein